MMKINTLKERLKMLNVLFIQKNVFGLIMRANDLG